MNADLEGQGPAFWGGPGRALCAGAAAAGQLCVPDERWARGQFLRAAAFRNLQDGFLPALFQAGRSTSKVMKESAQREGPGSPRSQGGGLSELRTCLKTLWPASRGPGDATETGVPRAPG